MRFWCSCLAWGLLLGSANVVAADSSVIVLGLRSVEGDDDAAFGLSRALRDEANEVPGWNVREQSVTLAQMSLAHGCEEVDAHCLADIAKALGVDMIIYGTVRRSSARDDYQYVARLNLFDATSGAIEQDGRMTFAQSLQDESMLRPVAAKLVAQLAPRTNVPTLTIETNVAGAEVYLDGELIGQVQDDSFTLEDVEAGEHRLEVTAVGYESFAENITLQPGEGATITANLGSSGETEDSQEESPSSGYRQMSEGIPPWLTGTAFGVGVVGLAGTVVSWLIIDGIEKDEAYSGYSNALAQAGKRNPEEAHPDLCVAAKSNVVVDGVQPGQPAEVANLCSRGDTFELLQYVFIGVAGVGVATGITLLIIDGSMTGGTDIAQRTPSLALSVRPILGQQRAGLSATLRF